jgi:hypothetical protein
VEVDMKEIFLRVSTMEEVGMNTMMGGYMMVSIIEENGMGKEYIHSLMEMYMKVIS